MSKPKPPCKFAMAKIAFFVGAFIFGKVASEGNTTKGIDSSRFYQPSKVTENSIFYDPNPSELISGKTRGDINVKDTPDLDKEIATQAIRTLCYMTTVCRPEFWNGTCQYGKSQSPVNLDVQDSANKSGYPFAFGVSYEMDQKSFFIANIGHSILVQLQKNGTSNCSFAHSDLRLNYTFSQLHFHLGKFGDDGSEHTVQSKRFPIEMHLVHYKSEHKTLDAALDSKDPTAVSVIAVFFKISSANKALEPILRRLKEITAKHTPEVTKVQETINLLNLLPTRKSFFRYQGSLTTATCAEAVLWVVFDDPLEMSNQQVTALRSLLTKNDEHAEASSYRAIQDLNGRTVEYFTG